MSRLSELGKFKPAAERSDLFDGRKLRQDKLMRGGLGQVTAGCAMVGIIVIGQRMFMLIGISTLILLVASAFAMMRGMLPGLMTSMVLRPVRVSPRRKQTIGQVQQDCTEGDEFEVLAEHRGYQC
jgi:hypothetical protein